MLSASCSRKLQSGKICEWCTMSPSSGGIKPVELALVKIEGKD